MGKPRTPCRRDREREEDRDLTQVSIPRFTATLEQLRLREQDATKPSIASTPDASRADEQYQAAVAAVVAPQNRNASARQKQAILWHFISRLPSDELLSPRTTNAQMMRQLVDRAFLRKAFVQDDDVRPARTKAFHAYRTVVQMRFDADGKHATHLPEFGECTWAFSTRPSLESGPTNYWRQT